MSNERQQEKTNIGSPQAILFGVLLGSVFCLLSAQAAPPVRTLPAPPGQILDLRANAAGDLYVRTATKVLWLDLQHPKEGWNALALDGVVDLSENAGREVFARQDLKTRFAIHRLAGGEATLIANAPQVPYKYWYVDAAGRTWFQTDKNLLVVRKDEELLNMPAKAGPCGFSFRQPCEWQPGHVVLLYGTEAVWATPDKVALAAPPPFDSDGTGNGLFQIGTDHLVGGGGGNDGRGSYRLDPRRPDKAPERLNLGWDWFRGVATAPDGRLLVLAQTDRNPQFTLFWYAANGLSQVRLKGAENVIRTWHDQRAVTTARLVFSTNSVGFTVTGNGVLAVFRPDEASILTPATGLPIPRVEHLAAVGDDLIMAGDGRVVVWRTTEPLPPAADFDDWREWPLAGPCVRDCNGAMWAFLLDFPGKLSRHDGTHWQHFDIDLGNRTPLDMTGDDQGRLQIGFTDGPSGSSLITNRVTAHWPNAPTRAWHESCKDGATVFSDGSPYRPRHVAGGRADRLWVYDGRMLWDAGREIDFYDSPPYGCYWLGADGTCYRGGAGRLWSYAGGRWAETAAPSLAIGPGGITTGVGPGRLPVTYDRQLKLTLQGALAGGKPHVLTLRGNEAFIPAADGGGWVGEYRVFHNAYYTLAGRVYPGTNGHYLVADKTLRFQARQTLTVTGEVLSDGSLRRLVCRIAGTTPLYKPRLLVFYDGEFREALANPTGGDLPPITPGPHTLDVYAADGFGVISAEPLRLSVNGPPEYPAEALKLDEAWALKPQRLQAVPTKIAGRTVLGWKLEIDADGVIWILVNGGVISLDLANRKAAFYPIPAHEILSARGRVWALGSAQRPGMKWPLYELGREGIRHAVDLYDDTSDRGFSQVSADGQGGIWTLSQQGMTRWDGKQTQFWERPVGSEQSTAFVPTPAGAIIHAWDRYFLYRNDELSQGIPWDKSVLREEGYMDFVTLYPLGRAHLVYAECQALVDVDTGQISKRKIPAGETYRWGGNGDLYVWQSNALLRVSGKNLAVTCLPRVPLPSHPFYRYTSDRYAFLATTNGILAYPSGRGSLILGPENGGAVEYGWREMVEPGDTMSIRQAPDGRIWILRTNQLLVYDPAQPDKPGMPAWPDWRVVPIWSGGAVGAFGTVWYITADGKTVVETDGKTASTWQLPLAGGFVIAGDQGGAMLVWCEKVFLLLPGGKVEPASDLPSAVLALVKRGAKAFAGGDPPVVAADGRVYFHGRIWDGQAWQALSEGRVSLDLRGNMFQLRGDHGIISIYRIDGCKATAVAETTKCLIDADGLRWCDPGLLEAKPGCLPVWYRVDPQGHNLVSATPDTQKIKVDIGTLQALPITDGQFLLRMNDLLYVLDANGLTALPNDRLPCGSKLLQPTDNITPLPDGRWAFGMGERLFFSPPKLRFTP
ncbi:MAG: hypothetical protein WCR06_04875 [bacterium]